MLSPIPWQDVEDALVAFFEGPTDLDVIWGSQAAPRPDYPYGELKVSAGPNTIGIDEKRMDVELEVVGQREIVVSFKIFGPPNDIGPTSHARAYMSALISAFEMPLYHDPLAVAGLAVRQIMSCILPDEQISNAWISRATLDVRFGLSANVSQALDVIEHVHATAVNQDLGTLPAPLVIDRTFP